MNLAGLEQFHQRESDDKADGGPFEASQNHVEHPVQTVAQANVPLKRRAEGVLPGGRLSPSMSRRDAAERLRRPCAHGTTKKARAQP